MQQTAAELELHYDAALGWFGTVAGVDITVRGDKTGKVSVVCDGPTGQRFQIVRVRDRIGLLAPNVSTGHAGFDEDFHATAEDPARLRQALDGIMCAALESCTAIRSVRGNVDHLVAVIEDGPQATDAVMVLTALMHRLVPSAQAA